MELTVRDVRKEEQNFILSSWIKNYLLGLEAELMGKNEAAKYLQGEILKLLSKGVEIKCIGDDETDEIYSYVVYDKSKVYFLYTKKVYRQNGFAKKLINECGLRDKEFSIIINPYMTRILVEKYNFKFRASFKL